MRRWAQKIFLPALALVGVATGCSHSAPPVPPEIHYGADTCADCGMIIGDPHYAAALLWRASAGRPAQTAVFDDIGCLLHWRRQHANAQIVAAWVKDVRTADWLNAFSALYLKSPPLETPMGSGIVATATPHGFAGLAVRHPVLTWSDLLNSESRQSPVATSSGHGEHPN